ncbi:MAG TPA: SprB repeat-containing protein, partial [Bacteroidales bacterium]|nr:SprB repeat-containing protein [Bacteroidales bacterium]
MKKISLVRLTIFLLTGLWSGISLAVNDPVSFSANAGSSSLITLSWSLNGSGNPVMLAFSMTPVFGNPVEGISYMPGSSLAGGGTVLYIGTGTGFDHSGLAPSTAYYYKAWSVAPGENYSPGVTACATTLCINNFPVSVTISASANPVCSGVSVTFTAVPVNGGATPLYQWKVNGMNAGTSNPVFTYVPSNGDLVTCVLTSGIACPAGNPATSNPLVLSVSPTLVVLPDTISNIGCNGGNDGAISIVVSGGFAPFHFLWNDGSTTQNLSQLYSGSYSVTVTDAIGCSAVANDLVITEPSHLILWDSVTNVNCSGGSNGSIHAFASGGTGSFSYFLQPPGSSNSSGVFSGLSAGTYSLTVSDASGCEAFITVSVTEDDSLSVFATGMDILCHGDNSGEIYLSVSGGSGDYSYSWNNGAYTDRDLHNLPAGLYYVTVTDSNGCLATTMDPISQPMPLTATDSVVPVSAYGINDGAIYLSAGGGTSPYSYSIDDGNTFQGSGVYSGLSATVYRVVIEDANGCSIHSNSYISVPSSNTVDTSLFFVVTPNMDSVANVTWGMPDTFPAFRYILERSNDSINFIAVDSITTDSLVDIMTLPPSQINPFGSILYSTESDPRFIYNESVPFISSRTLLFFRVKMVDSSQNILYSVPVRFINDAINHPPPKLTNNSSSAKSNDTFLEGTQMTNPKNCPPVESPPGGYIETVVKDTSEINCCTVIRRMYRDGWCGIHFECKNCVSECGCKFDDFCCQHNCSGYLKCSCKPWPFCGNNSSDDTRWIVISSVPNPLPTFYLNPTNVSCPGKKDGKITITGGPAQPPYWYYKIIAGPACFTSTHEMPYPKTGYHNNVFSFLCPGQYTVRAELNGCAVEGTVTIAEPKAPLMYPYFDCKGCLTIFMLSGISPLTYSTDGINYQTLNVFCNLSTGPHTIYVHQGNGCVTTYTVIKPPLLDITATKTDITCTGKKNGSITIATNKPNCLFRIVKAPACFNHTLPYPNKNGQISNKFSNLCPGVYTIIVKDKMGCEAVVNVTIDEPDPIVLTADVENSSCTCTGKITIHASGVTPTPCPGYQYQMISPPGPAQYSNVFSGLCAGCYIVKVTDCNGCTATIQKCITTDAGIPPPSGMVAWWPLDETAGSPAKDLMGFNNYGTYIGNPHGSPGKVAGCLSVNTFQLTIRDYLEATNHPELNFIAGEDFSVDAWIQPADHGG